MDDGSELVQCVGITAAPCLQEPGHIRDHCRRVYPLALQPRCRFCCSITPVQVRPKRVGLQLQYEASEKMHLPKHAAIVGFTVLSLLGVTVPAVFAQGPNAQQPSSDDN